MQTKDVAKTIDTSEDIKCVGSSSSELEEDEVITEAPDRVLPAPLANPSSPPKTKLMKKLDGKPF